jgi:GINS complex subunit 1
VREVRDLDRDVTQILAPYNSSTTSSDGEVLTQNTFNPAEHPATACALLVDHLSMRRNKRCLLAYHRVRAQRIEAWCWEGRDLFDYHNNNQSDQNNNAANMMNDGQVAAVDQAQAAAANSSLSPEEEEYFRQYTDLLAGYKGQWTDVDLTGSLVPPRDLFVDVRVLRDAGEIQTEYGAINLTKNSQFYVRLADVERLIHQGFLQRLS